MSKFLLFLLIVAVLVGGIWFFSQFEPEIEKLYRKDKTEEVAAADPLNASYEVEGVTITLTNGRSEMPIEEGSATVIATEIFGEPIYGDIDGDGDEDAGVLIKQEPGGTGTFYYVAATINEDGSYEGTNALLLGDRVAPQNVQISGGGVIANYADRGADEPMTATPSVGKTLRADFVKGKIIEVTLPSGGGVKGVGGASN